nr:MAG TPA: hypothetical protein [Caudoviricetes sp.]
MILHLRIVQQKTYSIDEHLKCSSDTYERSQLTPEGPLL